jgi:hypothetical protein
MYQMFTRPLGVPYTPQYIALRNSASRERGARAMTDWLISAVVFVAIITTLVYLWKREHG